eukprot:3996062-Heterocapsa_arctica.AAC.1
MKAPAEVRKTIMKKHSASFQNMPMELRLQYEARARAASSASHRTVEADLEHTRAQLQMVADRAAADEEGVRPPLSVSASQWDAADLASLNVLLRAPSAPSTASVKDHWRKAVVAPPLPSLAEQQALQAQSLGQETIPVPKPE